MESRRSQQSVPGRRALSERLICFALNTTPPTERSNFSAISGAEYCSAKSRSRSNSAGVQRFANRYSWVTLISANGPTVNRALGDKSSEVDGAKLEGWSLHRPLPTAKDKTRS